MLPLDRSPGRREPCVRPTRSLRGVVLAAAVAPLRSCWRTRTRSCRSTSSGPTCAGRRRRPPASASSGSTTTRAPLLPVGADLGAGWVPLAAALAGAVRRLPRGRAASAVPRPVAARLHRSTWDCRSASSAAGCCRRSRRSRCSPGSPWCARSMRSGRGRGRMLALAGDARRALLAQGLFYSVHSDRVLSRDDTRNLARAWMVENVPAGSKVVVEPIVPDAWFADPDVHDAADGRAPRPDAVGPALDQVPDRPHDDRRAGAHDRRGGKGRFVSVEDYERTLRPGAGRLLRARRLLLGGDRLDAVRARARRPRGGPERARATTASWPATQTVVQRDRPLPGGRRARSSSTSTGASTTTRAHTSDRAHAWWIYRLRGGRVRGRRLADPLRFRRVVAGAVFGRAG